MPRRSLSLAAALALTATFCAAQTDMLDRGAGFFLAGRLDNAIAFFSGVIKENPKDARAREILGYCLAIKGKDAMRDGQYDQAGAALARAMEFMPDNRELKMLSLMAEMEERAPTPSVPVSTAALNTEVETRAVFECLFGDGPCAKSGRYIVYVVQPGDTMADIAIKFYNDLKQWEKIWGANPQLPNPHRLEKGTKLLIPLP